ncbi:hypothetical protein H0E85_13675 [Lactiplantibacillus plantarum]|uniref:hypothetical protein n=1 Tax=Lactiplantibacillus plantarum TaxID=1590 RepID=UPI0015EBB548|nr:hypothetical protein [Lactiplantibacillus plantarum]QLQ49748.1 hypothetical protein H0E85_13675 [Lactiplantibacillus plantarum]
MVGNRRQASRAWIIILIIAVLTILPIILNQVGVLGVDSYFQYNRIYEAEMQIRHGNFSFLNLYSFQQAGRIVNQVYSPLLTFLFGAILLVTGTWFKFQIVSMILVNFFAGISMYYGAKKLKFNFAICVALASIYMTSFSIYGFMYSTSWRALAVAFVPLLIGPMKAFYSGDWTLREMLFLGVIVGIIAQAQIISAALVLPILVPFFVIGLIKTQSKWRALSLPIISLFFYGALAALLLFWRTLSGFTKTLTIMAVVYLVLGTNLVPWSIIGLQWPALESYLQLPRRFIITGLSFLFLSDMLVVQELRLNGVFHWTQAGIKLLTTIVATSAVVSLAVAAATFVARQSDPNISIAAGLGTNDNNVFAHRYHGKKIKTITDLQPVFHVKDKSALIQVVDRRTPDYVPIQGNYSTSTDYYSAYVRYVISPKSKFHHQVLPGGVLRLTWNQKRARQIRVPVVVYGNTQVILNGEMLAHKELRPSIISTPMVHGKRGANHIDLSYQPKMMTVISIWWSVLAWVIVGLSTIKYCLFNRQIKRG